MGLHSTSKIWKRDETAALIALYETERCLYDPKHKYFDDHAKQKEAYKRIHEVMIRVRPSCTIGEIKYKINYLQRQYAGEVLHRNISVQAGLSTEESYKSSMWCFGLLQFLNDYLPLMTTPKTDEPVETNDKDPVDKVSPEVPDQSVTNNSNHHKGEAGSSNTVIENGVHKESEEEEKIVRKKRKLCTTSSKSTSTNNCIQSSPDREEIFGQYVATEMKNLKDNPLLYLQTKQSILQILTSANFELINPE